MTDWLFQDESNPSPCLSGYRFGDAVEFRMTYVNDTENPYLGTYLFVDKQFIGVIQAKLSIDAGYTTLMAVNDALCYLGEIPIGNTDIDFRFSWDLDADSRDLRIPILMAHDDGALKPNPLFIFDFVYHEFWAPCYERSVFYLPGYGWEEITCEGYYDPSLGFTDDWTPHLWIDEWDTHLWS
jgi:hypothetical protein